MPTPQDYYTITPFEQIQKDIKQTELNRLGDVDSGFTDVSPPSMGLETDISAQESIEESDDTAGFGFDDPFGGFDFKYGGRVNMYPGGFASGKTKTACVIASELYKRNLIDRTIVIAPFTGVTLQWSEDFKDIVNRNMEKISSVEDISYTSFDTDICATWSALANIQDNIDLICKKQKTFVVCDEHHHAAVEAAWGESANSAFRNAKYCLILTGTPFRTDGKDCTWFNKLY